ncbi:MAG: DUF488 family protein [Rhodobacteraceae bacterium]|nr:DUF488 family protein [Paracoccaceae bacterium]
MIIRSTGPILTVGHSNHSREEFLDLLRRNKVDAVADVRSAPYSHYKPHFNREILQTTLENASIRYVFLGKELGGRSNDPHCYEADRIRYDLVEKTPLFQSGLERLMRGSKDYRISMMCSEEDPLTCHRTLLVAHALDRAGYDVEHIRGCGRREPHSDAMARLLDQFENLRDALPAGLFDPQPREERIQEAIKRQSGKVGYRISKTHEHMEETSIEVMDNRIHQKVS